MSAIPTHLCCILFVIMNSGHVSLESSTISHEFTVKILTWNINEKPSTYVDIAKLLDVQASQIPDLFAIGLQEVNRKNTSETFNERKWIENIISELNKYNYVVLSTVAIHGIFVIVFIRNDRLSSIEHKETSSSKLGAFSLGNIGATAVRFDINGISVCLVSAHFRHGDEQLLKRIEDYHVINNEITFSNPNTKLIANHDLIFWFGDLNFRLENYTANEIIDILNKEPLKPAIDKLLEKDELKKLMKAGDVFVDYVDLQPKFKPTYKYNIGTNEYDLKRKPAFTDRVLYRNNKYGLKVKQLMYSSTDIFKISDHMPVTALFSVHLLRSLNK